MNRTTALVYVRVSRLDAEERERKLSPDMQREKALALTQLEGLAIEVFDRDIDISGKDTAHRPDYLRMLERLARGGVRYVVAYDLSRITRNVGDQQAFFDALQRSGAQFLEASSGRVIDPTDEDQELGANVLGSVNQHARRKTARRVRDTLATKAARGELVGPVPAGYLRKKEILPSGRIARTWVEPDPETAPIVQLIFREYATGKYSLKSLAVALNDRGVRPPRAAHFRNGQPASEIFTADVLKDLLNNPRYVGRVPRRDGRLFSAAYAALIDEATWNACVRTREAGRRVHNGTRQPSQYLLSGVLRCDKCGKTMGGGFRSSDRSHHEARYMYRCYWRRTSDRCRAADVPRELLEGQILEILRAVTLPAGAAERFEAAVKARLGSPAGGTSRASTLASIDERLRRLADLYELGRIQRDEYVRRATALDCQRSELQQARSEPVLERQAQTLRTLVDDWDGMTIAERRLFVGRVFAEVRADRSGIREFLPREGWRDYVSAVLPHEGEEPQRGQSERKTGLEPPANSPSVRVSNGGLDLLRRAA